MGKHASLFFTLVTRNPQMAAGHMTVQSPPHMEARSGATGHVTLRSPSNRFEAAGYVAASEPILARRRVPIPLDT
jgi:hypothetical protein